MDKLYQTFKGWCKTKTLRIVSDKLTARSRKIVRCYDTLKTLRFRLPNGVLIENLKPEDEVKGDTPLLIKKTLNKLGIVMKQPTLSNADLYYIFNSCEGELLNDCPFDYIFVKDRIIKANKRVGCVLLTRAYLKNKHVRHGLGQHKKNDTIER